MTKKIIKFFFFFIISITISSKLFTENKKEEFIKQILLEIDTIKSKVDIKNPINDYLKIAHLYIQIEDYNEATNYINKIIEKDPKNSRAHYLLALIYEKKKEYDKAINIWQKVLEYSTTKEMKEIAQKHIDYLNQIKK